MGDRNALIQSRLGRLIRRALRLGDSGSGKTGRTTSSPDVAPQVDAISAEPHAKQPQTVANLSAALVTRLTSGQGYVGTDELRQAEQLVQLLGRALDTHENRFSAQRHYDLLGPILAQLKPPDLAGATIVDLGCGTLNPFTLSFLLLGLGAERAYAIDAEPVQSMETATRALSTAAGWLLLEPRRLVDRPEFTAADVLRNLEGFELALLAAGDPAGIAPRRLIHRVERLDELSLRNEEADIVLSVSLLEHFDPHDALESLFRITKPGGLGIHVIDLVDHRFYAGQVASPFEFLKVATSDSLVHGSNRIRCDEFCAMFEQHRFRVERVERWSSVPPPTGDEQAEFVEPYRSAARENIKTTGARIFTRRQGEAPTRRARPAPQVSERVVGSNTSAGPEMQQPDSGPHQPVYAELLRSARGDRGSDYVPLSAERAAPDQLVKLIAFYLPQFHPIPENDAWWGRGFTEWTNVSKATPQFLGHYQPRLPGELGFYDLRVPEVQRRQVELAKQYGLFGFCFYYYWFGGKRLLERPLNQFVTDPMIDFPFCLCWANENWTRRWDGREDQILIEQPHTDEADAAFIADIEPLLRHERYIRIHGRPVVLVYRPALLHDPARTADRWREHCQRAGVANPYLVATEAFESVDPASIGFDAAVQFPPNTGGRRLPTAINSQLSLVNPAYAGAVYRYTDMLRLKADGPEPTYQQFKAVCPGFDNEPRRPGSGSTYAFSSPATYGRWLESACRLTLAEPDREKRLVFINAWNEWGEGAHLEPDRRFGYAYLDATAKALGSVTTDWTILFVSHDACRGGAQLVLLDFLAWLKAHTSIRIKVLCLESGEWLPRFHAVADTVLWSELEDQAARAMERELTTQILDFCGCVPDLIYGNSVASGRAYRSLRKVKAPILTHFHEMETSIARYAGEWREDVIALSAHHIACSDPVRQNLVANVRRAGEEDFDRSLVDSRAVGRRPDRR